MTSNTASSSVRKICVVTGNQADYTRCRTVMRAIDRDPRLELQTVVTGAHLLRRHGYTVDLIVDDGFTIDEKIYQIIEGENPTAMARSIGLGICDLATCFERLRPDVAVVPGDRFEALSAAIAASAMNIPVAHIQGGEVTGSFDESIRHAITKLSHIHFPATEDARKKIIAMGENPDFVFNVGCPGTDSVLEVTGLNRKQFAEELKLLWKNEPLFCEDEPFLLLVQHPVTTQFEEQEEQILKTLDAVFRTNLYTICFWPNVDAGAGQIVEKIRVFSRRNGAHGRYFTLNLLSPLIFVNMMRHAACMVGNSSAGIRETCYLGTPVVNVGIRQQRRERGHNVVDSPNDSESIYRAIMAQVEHGRYEPTPIYGDGRAGEKVAETLAEITLPSIQKVLQC
ncbi:MAG: UDP-N-acetylglucosamine 2-epimerase [Nitrospinota bacterium]|jgi:UDP-hydrolysing UDP-N-acetyl-D-glucosamine 2-epimerase|nr:UDP-N-acetylglucosamine 2-epimerase [Nitrospinota bacterium]